MVAGALDELGGTAFLVKCGADPKTRSAFLTLIGKASEAKGADKGATVQLGPLGTLGTLGAAAVRQLIANGEVAGRVLSGPKRGMGAISTWAHHMQKQ